MKQKLSFSVEDAKMINENPDSNFAVLALDFFASGENLHDMYVSEETLMRTADTIKNCPIVWKYDETLDDIYTHDKDEVPCGFVPESSNISNKKLEDGRTMLSVVAYVWKRYTGELLNFFKRDGGKKPVSVEMSVYEMQTLPNGYQELLDFKYEGITVLGSFVTPAIPMAAATILSFAELTTEYNDDLRNEFDSDNIKTSFSHSDKSAEKWAEQIVEKMDSKREIVTFPYKSIKDANPALRGISPPITVEQANEIARQADAIGSDDKKNGWAIAISSFKKTHTVKDGKWVKKEKTNMTEQEKLEKMTEEVKPTEEVKEVEMAFPPKEEKETPAEEKKESPAEEEKEKKEGTEKKFEFPKNMSVEKMAALFSDDSDEDDIKMAKEEWACKGEFADPAIVMGGMFAKMCKMAEMMEKMAADSKVYMAENEELKKFKAEFEGQQKQFAIDKTFKALEEKVIIPDDARNEMIAEAEKYSFAQIEEWETYCKAKSFDFAVKDGSKSDVVRIGIWSTGVTKKPDELWS